MNKIESILKLMKLFLFEYTIATKKDMILCVLIDGLIKNSFKLHGRKHLWTFYLL